MSTQDSNLVKHVSKVKEQLKGLSVLESIDVLSKAKYEILKETKV